MKGRVSADQQIGIRYDKKYSDMPSGSTLVAAWTPKQISSPRAEDLL